MSTMHDTEIWVGAAVRDPQDERVGEVRQMLLDPQTGEPAFAEVRMGRFGRRARFIPVGGTETHDGDVHIPWSKGSVAGAPDVGDHGGGLTRAQEEVLQGYYDALATQR